MNLNPMSSVAPSFVHPAPAGPMPVGYVPRAASIDLSATFKDLHAQAAKQAASSSEAAHDALQAIWRWICAMVRRLAEVLGLRAEMQSQLSEEQLRGEVESKVNVGDEQGDDPAKTEAATETVFQETQRLLGYIQERPFPVELFTQADTTPDFVRHHAERLGKYRSIFKDEVQLIEAKLDERYSALAAAAGTTPAVIRQQVVAGVESGLYDKDGTLKAMIEDLLKAKSAMGRCELAAASFVEMVQHEKALPGLHEFALEQFSRWMPEVQLDRVRPPGGKVAQTSGETSAVGDAPVGANSASERAIRLDDQRAVGEASNVVQDTIGSQSLIAHTTTAAKNSSTVAAQNLLESGPLQAGPAAVAKPESMAETVKAAAPVGSTAAPVFAGLRPPRVSTADKPDQFEVTDDERSAAMRSSIAGDAFSGRSNKPSDQRVDGYRSNRRQTMAPNGG